MKENDAVVESTAYVRTFLIADIRGYTSFTLEHGDEAAGVLAAAFARITRATVTEFDGTLLELRGDEALVVFTSARRALLSAVELQRRYHEAAVADSLLCLRVGIGLDAGESVPVEEGFRGAALNLAARLCSAARAGEVLASQEVVHLAGRMQDLDYTERESLALKGLDRPIRPVQVATRGHGGHLSGSSPDAEEIVNREVSLPRGGFLGAIPDGSLVGREVELAQIDASLARVEVGVGQLIFLSGEPGIGKTRLAQEVMLRARACGFIVACGRCYESQRSVPYYPFLEVLQSLHAVAPVQHRGRVATDWPLLPRLIPAAGTPPSSSQFGSYEEQQRLFWSVTEFLQVLSEIAPVAILLDDVHWGDDSTLQLLHHVAQHARTGRIFLLATYRTMEIKRGHPLDGAILELTREHLLMRMPVAPLDSRLTGQLIVDRAGIEVSDRWLEEIHRRTDGNPFFTEELVRSLSESGRLVHGAAPDDELEIPETVRATIMQRFDRLDAVTQEVLELAAVLGHTFLFDDLLLLSGVSDTALERALLEAAEAGLVREMDAERYTFSHALARDTLYAGLAGRRRRRLHLQAGQVLESQLERVRLQRAGELAAHFTHAADPGRALPYLVSVGDRAASAFAHREAETHYREALRSAAEVGDATSEAAISEKLGGLLTAMIRYSEALEVLEHAAALYGRSDDGESEGRVIAQAGRVHFSPGDAPPVAGIESVQRYLAAAGTVSDSAQAALRSVLAKLLIAAERYAEASREAERAIHLARVAGAAGVRAEAVISQGVAGIVLGDLSGGEGAIEAGIDIATGAGDLFSVCRGVQYLGSLAHMHGELQQSRNLFERARTLALQMDNRRQVASCDLALGELAFLRGEVEQADGLLNRALEIQNSLSRAWNPPYYLVLSSQLASRQGKHGDAKRFLDECAARAVRTTGLESARVAACRARVALAQGDSQAAWNAVYAQSSEPLLRAVNGYSVFALTLDVLITRAYILLARGDLEAAKTLAAGVGVIARQSGMRLALADALFVLGAVCHRAGDESGRQYIDEAAEIARACGYVPVYPSASTRV